MPRSLTFFMGVLLLALFVSTSEAKSFGTGSKTADQCAPNEAMCWEHAQCCSGQCYFMYCRDPPLKHDDKKKCAPNGAMCWEHAQCCSGRCSLLNTCVDPPSKQEKHENKTECTPNQTWCWTHDECCSGYCSRIGSIQICINPPSRSN